MSDNISNGSFNTAKNLSDLGDDYLRLISAGQPSNGAADENKNCRWTGVVATEHFAIAGCVENNLEDDVADAWREIVSIRRDAGEPWEFIFNAKDYELPDAADDLEEFCLPVGELEDLGRQVTRLRQQVSQRTAAIKAIGDAADVPQVPPALDMTLLTAAGEC